MTDREIMAIYATDNKRGNELMIEKYRDYVYCFLWRKFPTYMKNYPEEMFQSCIVGLLEAIRKYDPDKGCFSTLATKYLLHEAMSQICYLSKEGSRYYANIHGKIKKAAMEFEHSNKFSSDEINAISRETGFNSKIVRRELSLNTQDADYAACNLVVPFQPSSDFIIHDLLAGLTHEQSQIVTMRVVENLPFKEIAKRTGLTPHMAQKIYGESIQYLKSTNAA